VLTLIAYSLEFGKRLGAGLAVAFVAGQLTALLVGLTGVALMMAKMPEAIGVLRFAGGCLLLYVGFSALLQKRKQTPEPEPSPLKEKEYSQPLNVEEERHYVSLAQMGDENARATMVEFNLRLLVKIARYYSNRGLTQLDLIIEGYLALISSIEKFDPEGGVPFSLYAAWRIRHAVECAIMMNPPHLRSRLASACDSFGPDVDPPRFNTHIQNNPIIDTNSRLHHSNSHAQLNKWLMSLEPKDRNIVAGYFGLHGYDEASRKGIGIGHTSTVSKESHCYAVANTWFIAASSPIAIVFYTVVFPDFVDVADLDSRSLVLLGSSVFGISLVTSAFYILTACYARTVFASSAIGKKISSLANFVLILAGVWVINSAVG